MRRIALWKRWMPPGAVGLVWSYSIVVVLLIFAWVVAVVSLSTVRQGFQTIVTQGDALSARLNDVSSSMVNQESGLRGYLLTNDRQFLKPYQAGRQNLDGELRVALTLAHRPVERTMLHAIGRAADQWEVWATRRLTVPSAGVPSQTEIAGKRLFDTFRHRVDALQQSLRADHEFQLSSSRRGYDVALTILTMMVAGAAVVVALLAYRSVRVFLNELRARQRAEHAEDALKRSMEGYRSLVETSPDGVFLLGLDGRVRMSNAQGARLLGFDTPAEIVNMNALAHISPEDRSRAADTMSRRIQLDEVRGQGSVYRVTRADGSCFPAEVSSSTINEHGEAQAITVVVRDITDRTWYEDQLRHQALHDPLTDLPNRALLLDRLEQGLCEAQRDGHPLTLLLMDLNRFKEVNDTFGHGVGDVLLQQLGQTLTTTLRGQDTVARLGGDEFAILLPHTDERGGLLAAERIRTALGHPFPIEGHQFDVAGAIGIAVFPQHGADASILLRHADVAMYVAKSNDTGFAVYDPEEDRHSPGRLTLVSELRRAIAEDELVLHYQPKIEFGSGEIAGVEALVRWNHPERGMIPPDQFINLAEHTGLIKPLSAWVLDHALQQARVWLEQGMEMTVAVNLSARNLLDPTLVSGIAELLTRRRVPPSILEIELTESSVMADPERATRVLHRLHDMGVRLSIDDFGTGYSSLAYLKQLPVDEIKIDRSFVLDMARDSDNCSIVRATISLGHDLGMKTVAEGVEDQDVWDQLAALQCDLGQGYFLTRPLSAAECTSWLRHWQLQIAS